MGREPESGDLGGAPAGAGARALDSGRPAVGVLRGRPCALPTFSGAGMAAHALDLNRGGQRQLPAWCAGAYAMRGSMRGTLRCG